MAELMVAGAALGALFNVVFDRLASAEVVGFFREKDLGPLLDRMKTTLTVVRAVLNDAEKKQIRDSNVNDWLNELKDVVYMADDLLDQVSTKAAAAAVAATQKKVTTSNLLSGCFNAQHRKMATRSRPFNTQDGRKIATRLEEIVDKLEHILKLKKSLDLKDFTTDNSLSRVESTSVPDGKIYGREEDKETIIKLLLNDSINNEGEEISVIPIVGMGGVGKTTLAQMVYNDKDLQKKFHLKAWACVSQPFDIMKVTETLSEKLIPKEASKLTNLNSLQEKLVEGLKGKKFFIILDDVWNDDYNHWNLFKKPFQSGVRGSVILVTTRHQKVASIVQTVQTYPLSELSNEDCWSVFANHACLSPGSGENTTILEKIGLEIVKKCKGLPLAAQSLGGLLRRKRDIKDWNSVLRSDIWELSESESNIIPSLRISYHYLPPCLKRCFVYCSLFPKDFEFEKEDVIQLWMAEDLLPPNKGKALEDVGDECFDYLVSSSFIQRSRIPLDKECFLMHDLMHDLATFLGGEFYFRTDNLGEETRIGSKTRHLSFINFSSPNSETLGVLDSSKFLRTFLRMGEHSDYGGEEVTCTEVLSLEWLRVLSFCCFLNFCALPDSIGGMIHLRYLDLSWTGINSLPESLCNLYNLQTLKLNYCLSLIMLPSGMQNLVNLHYLSMFGTCIVDMPKGMSKLKQLHHLTYFTVGKHEEIKIKELGGLSNLYGHFSIKKLENVENGSEALEARMMDKKHIRDLGLHWSLYSYKGCMDSQTDIDILCKLQPHQDLESLSITGYRGTRYPDWVGKSCFPNMTRIELSDCKNCCTLPSLGHLPSLKHLSISNWKTLETIDGSFLNNNSHNDGGSLLTVVPFPSLISLQFEKMPCWEVWSCSDQPHAFPQLKRLIIEHCPKLKGDFPSDLPALEELEIKDCRKLACSLPRSAPALQTIKIKKANKVCELLNCSSMISSLRTLEIESSNCDSLMEIESSNCDSLTSLTLDTFPNIEVLSISDYVNLESLSVSQSGDGDVTLQNLTYLKIQRCPNLVSLAREGLPAPKMTKFQVFNCQKLESLPRGMNTLLPDLKTLEIHDCPRIEWFLEQGMPPSLREISLYYCEKLLRGLCDGIWSFPKEGLLPPSLKSLSLCGFPSLRTLNGKELLHLTSLRHLTISYCPKCKLENMEGEQLTSLGFMIRR